MIAPALPAGNPQELGFSIKALQRIDSVIAGCVARRRFPGAVSLIARRGQIAWFNAQGRLEPQGATAIPADAIFRIFSMTKPVVSVAIMMLVEDGQLLLTDPLQKYIPEFGRQKVAVEPQKNCPIEPGLPARPCSVRTAKTETEPVAGGKEIGTDYDIACEVVRRHQLDGFAAKDARFPERAAAQEHLHKACIISCRRHEAAAARLKFRDLARPACTGGASPVSGSAGKGSAIRTCFSGGTKKSVSNIPSGTRIFSSMTSRSGLPHTISITRPKHLSKNYSPMTCRADDRAVIPQEPGKILHWSG